MPELTRSARSHITINLNGRYIKNYSLFKAITDGYGSKLMVGRYPIAVLNIELNPILTDVNVHPTKQTVRISKEEQLCNLVAKTIYDTIYKENLIPDVMTRDRAVKPKYTNQQLQMEINQYSVANHAEPSKEDIDPQNITRDVKDDQKNEVDLKVSNIDSIFITNRNQLNDDNVIEFAKKYSEPASPFDEDENILVESKPAEVRFPKLLYIGQLHGTYLICESDDGMYIVDQHAAQERINYERLREEIGEVSDDQQNLLVPLVLNYPNRDALIISEKLETLKKLA